MNPTLKPNLVRFLETSHGLPSHAMEFHGLTIWQRRQPGECGGGDRLGQGEQQKGPVARHLGTAKGWGDGWYRQLIQWSYVVMKNG